MVRPNGAGGLPVKADSRPPFEPGNQAAVTHGSYSPRMVDPRARDIVNDLLSSGPEFLANPAFRPTLWLLAQTLTRIELIHEWIDGQGGEFAEDKKGRIQVASERLTRLTRLAADLAGKLGGDPLTQAKIQKDLAQGHAAGIGALLAEGRRLRQQAEHGGTNISDC